MYREFPSTVPGVLCTWERSGGDGSPSLIVPDGCVDLVWFGDGGIEVAGPDTRARWSVPGGEGIVGLRFAPARARGFLGGVVGTLRDEQPRFPEVGRSLRQVATRLEDRTAMLPRQRRRLLEGEVGRPGPPADGLVGAAVARLGRDPRITVGSLAGDLGISARQLQRRFVDEVGYGPKFFARVVRLHRLLDVVGREGELGSAAIAAGYASQSHLGDEVRELTSLTPVRFVEAWGRAPA